MDRLINEWAISYLDVRQLTSLIEIQEAGSAGKPPDTFPQVRSNNKK